MEKNENRPGLRIDYFDFEGLSVRYAVSNVQSSESPLLIFNGIGQNIEVLLPVIEALDAVRVVTYDVPGTGLSDTPLLPWRYWQHARVAVKLLNLLDIDKAHVLGVSWGGGLAQQFARCYPKRTATLILAATSLGQFMVPGKLSAYIRMASLRRYWDPNHLRSEAEHIYGGDAGAVQSLLDGHSQRLRAPSQRGFFYQAMAMAGWTSLLWLRRLRQPTLILHGADDPLIPKINASIMAALIPNARLQLVDCGHMFLLTRLQQVAPLMDEFMHSQGVAQ